MSRADSFEGLAEYERVSLGQTITRSWTFAPIYAVRHLIDAGWLEVHEGQRLYDEWQKENGTIAFVVMVKPGPRALEYADALEVYAGLENV